MQKRQRREAMLLPRTTSLFLLTLSVHPHFTCEGEGGKKAFLQQVLFTSISPHHWNRNDETSRTLLVTKENITTCEDNAMFLLASQALSPFIPFCKFLHLLLLQSRKNLVSVQKNPQELRICLPGK